MYYLCMNCYTKFVYNFDKCLPLLITEINLTKKDANNKLDTYHSLFRFWFNVGIIKISTYNKILFNLSKNNLV